MNQYMLLASRQMTDVAARVIRLRPEIKLGEISWKRFPDSFPDTFIHDIEGVKKSHVSFLACFDTPDTIFEQVSVMYTLASLRPRSLRFLLPYFPTGTMERRDHEGQVATAGTLAQMFSAVAPAGPGSVPLFIWDIHALPIREFFGVNISPQFKTGTKLLKERLIGRDVSIAFPDEGAYKRFHGMFEENGKPLYPTIICRKVRDGDQRLVAIIEGTARGRDVVIVDDLVHSGGTTLMCLKALQTAGARSVSAYATHGVLEKQAWKKFLKAGFNKVWITDSCPETAKAVEGAEPFEVLSLAKSIGNAVVWPEE
jgi:ribose-phosphate pyrophosphokinase